jgi:hypothetical protein
LSKINKCRGRSTIRHIFHWVDEISATTKKIEALRLGNRI